jgi:hypothetical protein
VDLAGDALARPADADGEREGRVRPPADQRFELLVEREHPHPGVATHEGQQLARQGEGRRVGAVARPNVLGEVVVDVEARRRRRVAHAARVAGAMAARERGAATARAKRLPPSVCQPSRRRPAATSIARTEARVNL